MLGVFWKTGEFDFQEKHKGWYITFTFMIFIALILVILGAFEHSSVGSLLSYFFSSLSTGVNLDIFIGILVLLAMIGVIFYVSRKPKGGEH